MAGRIVRGWWVDGLTRKRLWTPLQIAPLLAAWYDAADLSTLSFGAGGGVSQWRDKSPNQRHLIQATAGNQPTYGTFRLNGVPLVCTDAAGPRFMDAAAWTPPADFDFFWITTSDGAAQGVINALYDHDHSAAPNSNWTIQSDNVGFGSSPNTTTHYAAQFTGAWQLVGSGANGIVTSGPVLGLFRRQSSASLVRAGTTLATATFAAMTRVSRAFRVGGCISTSGRGWRGGHREIIYTNTPLSSIDAQRVEGYLAWRAGLQGTLIASHPFRTRPPLAL